LTPYLVNNFPRAPGRLLRSVHRARLPCDRLGAGRTRVLSFEAISNRLKAKIKARTLAWSGAAGPVILHLRQVIIGVLMFRPARMHWSISSSSSRRLMRAGIDIPSCHFDRNHVTTSGNHVFCASPEGIFWTLHLALTTPLEPVKVGNPKRVVVRDQDAAGTPCVEAGRAAADRDLRRRGKSPSHYRA